MKKFLVITFVFGFFVLVAGGVFVAWGWFYITRDLPHLSTIDDYFPNAVTRVYARDGELVGEFYKERRYPTKLEEVPIFARNCFLAAEDASFYQHPGIDPMSILRALVKNIQTGEARQGGSTITQQVVKNLLLTPEKKLKRKIKEAILSYQLEEKFSKDEILELYLNQIYFGNTAYGIKAATQLYFRKELSDLTLAEAAMLAGLPKAPSKYSPISHYDRARRRQRYVLKQMERAGFITKEAAEIAAKEEVKVFPARTSTIYKAPYYVSEVRRLFLERWKDLDIDRDGLEIHTALDVRAYAMAEQAVRTGLRDVDKRRGWRGPIDTFSGADESAFLESFKSRLMTTLETGKVFPALVTDVDLSQGTAEVFLGEVRGSVDLKEASWAKRRLDSNERVTWVRPEHEIRRGDVIEVELSSLPEDTRAVPGTVDSLVLSQTPDIEGGLVLLNPHTGEVLTVIGGYSYQRSQFNRATQGKRQPGSAFKPIIYLAAIDRFGYTPATIVYDQQLNFRVGDDYWSPDNFDEKFLGPITLRTALERSRNLVSADIISRIGVDAAIEYARKMGIESKLGRNLSLSLGSAEVSMLEIVRAYGVFAAQGVLFPSVFITKIVNRDGEVLYDMKDELLTRASQVVDENSAFVIANMMKGVVQHGTGYRVRSINRPVAGKTGTSNDQMDAWFVGYTPEWACGVWGGFDQKKKIGAKETGGRVSAPIWLEFMTNFLNYQDERKYQRLVEEAKEEAERLGIEYVPPELPEPLDFPVPEGVDPFWIDKMTGTPAEPGAKDAILEYFKKGTGPRQNVIKDVEQEYLDSVEL